jgi:hypothetical protein
VKLAHDQNSMFRVQKPVTVSSLKTFETGSLKGETAQLSVSKEKLVYTLAQKILISELQCNHKGLTAVNSSLYGLYNIEESSELINKGTGLLNIATTCYHNKLEIDDVWIVGENGKRDLCNNPENFIFFKLIDKKSGKSTLSVLNISRSNNTLLVAGMAPNEVAVDARTGFVPIENGTWVVYKMEDAGSSFRETKIKLKIDENLSSDEDTRKFHAELLSESYTQLRPIEPISTMPIGYR